MDPVVAALEVGVDGFFGVHLVFKLLVLLLLVDVPLVPPNNSGVCNYSVYGCVAVVRRAAEIVARVSAYLVGSKFRTWRVLRDVARESPTYA